MVTGHSGSGGHCGSGVCGGHFGSGVCGGHFGSSNGVMVTMVVVLEVVVYQDG